MKTVKSLKTISGLLCLLLTLTFTSCRTSGGVSVGVGGSTSKTTVKTKPLPPGQAKKVYGGKSAKKYAPGQQNKQ